MTASTGVCMPRVQPTAQDVRLAKVRATDWLACKGMHRVGVCALVRNPLQQVLLVRTAHAGWELPGGSVEVGEELMEALARELLEETSCSARIDRLVGIYSHQALLILVFTAMSDTTAVAPMDSDECLAAAWFAPAEALRNVTHPAEHDRLVDALADAPGVIYRSYVPGHAGSQIRSL